ncbi:MAG: hypothetical protein JXQ71_13890 [Verrucomicrobia bacterium]|nr:hypothetical protein [Verrucomicrobiota bacterium]
MSALNTGYIDIDPAKRGRTLHGRGVVDPDDMPGPARAMVLGYVGTRGTRDRIRPQLERRGYAEGEDDWMAA